ncbi:hypothetical protein, partial [Streptomyces lavendulocolor]|uniref:hypothetical protein n=1 Tax=Streptomyces lavendulocolor TaxID=67316 RepID=UPI0033F2BACF
MRRERVTAGADLGAGRRRGSSARTSARTSARDVRSLARAAGARRRRAPRNPRRGAGAAGG